MANNRTNRGVLILMSIMALIVGVMYLCRRNPHPLDAEARLQAEASLNPAPDSVNAADSVRPLEPVGKNKSKKPSVRNRTKKPAPHDLPSPHDSPVSTISKQ